MRALIAFMLFLCSCGGKCPQYLGEMPFYYGSSLDLESATFIPPGNSILIPDGMDPDAYYRRLDDNAVSRGYWVQTRFTSELALRPREESAYTSVQFVFCLDCYNAGLR